MKSDPTIIGELTEDGWQYAIECDKCGKAIDYREYEEHQEWHQTQREDWAHVD